MQASMMERPSQRDVLRSILNVATEMGKWTDSGRLFQRDGVQEWKALASVSVLALGTERLIPLFDLGEQDGSYAASMEWRSFQRDGVQARGALSLVRTTVY